MLCFRCNWYILLSLLLFLPFATLKNNNAKQNNVVVEDLSDYKDFKKLIRTKTNVLALYVGSSKQASAELKIFREAAQILKGSGTFLLIECNATPERKKLCKKLKVNAQPFELKHYKDGDFHLNYNRQMSVGSMVNFMRDPTGDLPWDEDEQGRDVLHFGDYATFQKHLKRDLRPMLVMFYVPWCGFCKRFKPDYAKAAAELKQNSSEYVLAAMDVERVENALARRAYNITGFPTLLYFEHGQMKQPYEGENNRESIVSFMQNPTAALPKQTKQPEPAWSSEPHTAITHLSEQNFESALSEQKSALVMFYAPWCGHCQRMKPDYEKAAKQMSEKRIAGMLAALDATKERSIAEKYKVQGYPTLKYFVQGNYKYDVNVRDLSSIIAFMQDPREPPPPEVEKAWHEEHDASNIHFLSDANFVSTLKRKKHALVMFYAPWCGHCKNAKPEFTAAAQHFAEDPRINFVAIDCASLQEFCKSINVRGYPTFKYYSYYKIQQDYDGGRTRKDFIDYMSNPPGGKAHEEL